VSAEAACQSVPTQSAPIQSVPAPVRLVFDAQGPLREAARACEAEVFSAWFGNTAGELAEAYGKYEDSTHWLVIADADDRVLAVSRLIWPGPAGWKTIDDLACPPWEIDSRRAARQAGLDLDRTLDVTTMAVRRGVHRLGFDASHAMAYGLFGAMRMNGIESMVALLDAVPLELLRGIGLNFTPIPGTAAGPYFGSAATTPVYARMDSLLAAQERLAPAAHQAIRHGIGLAGVELPAPEALRL
jgi:hypothetical protein